MSLSNTVFLKKLLLSDARKRYGIFNNLIVFRTTFFRFTISDGTRDTEGN